MQAGSERGIFHERLLRRRVSLSKPKSTTCRATGKDGKAGGKGQKGQKGTQERQERRKRSEMIKALKPKPIRINIAKGVELFCFLECFNSINQ